MTRLAVIGDLHYAVDAENTIPRKLKDDFYVSLLDSFFACDADFHVALGDLTHFGTQVEWDSLMKLISQCNHPHQRNFRYILGNHDTLHISKEQITEITRLPRYFQEELDMCKLVFLDTTYEARPQNWGGFVDDEQLHWLSQQPIEESRPVLMFGHHPLPNTTLESDQPMMSIENGNEVFQVIQPIGSPIIYFNGHNHIHSITHEVPAYPDCTFIQSAAVLSTPLYRVVTIDPKEISVNTVHLSLDISSIEFRNHIQAFFHQQDAFGHHSDQSIKVPRNASAGQGTEQS